MVLAWNLEGPAPPPVDVALSLARQFTEYGRIVADDLRAQCQLLPGDSYAVRCAGVTLGEASRRLQLALPDRTPQAAGHRAQNIARLLKALLRAVGEVGEGQARTADISSTPRRKAPDEDLSLCSRRLRGRRRWTLAVRATAPATERT
ncbi:DUF6415 family natural product biosynthesis protein [Streptomyces sp. 891-h]|uniref:DUF6415 family natural product biosynthesis protein n=1 Tax=Streptomyces sp. 891-h TaxID=2720714 RepID=UPI001FA9C45A|nr:DUF6415 family natural product biosynthesis protein [Streptomyces sp. 891-h]